MRKIFIRTSLTLCTIVLASCLSDEKYALDPSGTSNVIEFIDPSVPNSPSGSIYPAWDQAFQISPEATFERTIKFSGPNSNNKDIELTVEVDPAALDEYNEQMKHGLNGNEPLGGATYELLPEANYDIESLSLTIPKGERTATLSVKIYPTSFDLTKKYALPVRIVTASSGVLSAHYSVAIFGVAIKNKYDADYTTDVLLTGWAAYNIQDGGPFLRYPGLLGLVTTGPNTVGIANYAGGGNLIPGFTNTGGATQFGNSSPVFTFDLATDKLTNVVNAIFPNSQNRTFAMNPAAAPDENVFNPAERSIKLNFLHKQTGRPDQTIRLNLAFSRER